MHERHSLDLSLSWFRSVVVITSALHAEGPGFEPQRNHYLLSFLLLKDDDETYFMDLLFNKQSI